MRIDKFLNAVNIVKRRAIAQDMIANRVVFINDKVAKASKDVKIGDKITIKYLEYEKNYIVLDIPKTKTIPKSKMNEYVKEI
ncbi:RNA-binding S4 domain-containing protein [Nitrosophilus kaiyonis]|uniref:RNA-binding S4 domain-containing protein n=1 Tax=Nitrosophilus kaiyonis TaxID=2930200 RepID=UPI0024924E5E|nr:S4 domain-containing protein [Nitrosophilus kaiyonis]